MISFPSGPYCQPDAQNAQILMKSNKHRNQIPYPPVVLTPKMTGNCCPSSSEAAENCKDTASLFHSTWTSPLLFRWSLKTCSIAPWLSSICPNLEHFAGPDSYLSEHSICLVLSLVVYLVSSGITKEARLLYLPNGTYRCRGRLALK